MTVPNTIKIFNDKKIRAVWDSQNEKWYFSVVDVIDVLTDSVNPTDYLKKMRKRDPELNSFLGTICPQVMMPTETGKQRKTLAADTQSLFRIIQSVPSSKAEPFKLWIAQVAKERIDEMQDPELTIERAMWEYKNLGYSDDWINQRLKTIEVRKELTDEWKKHGLKEGVQFATLTDIITQAWSGLTTREYKQLKGLKKENLRDNMTNIELILNMLAEASTKNISQETNPQTFEDNKRVAREGGEVAYVARKKLESRTSKKIVTPQNAKDIHLLSGENEPPADDEKE